MIDDNYDSLPNSEEFQTELHHQNNQSFPTNNSIKRKYVSGDRFGQLIATFRALFPHLGDFPVVLRKFMCNYLLESHSQQQQADRQPQKKYKLMNPPRPKHSTPTKKPILTSDQKESPQNCQSPEKLLDILQTRMSTTTDSSKRRFKRSGSNRSRDGSRSRSRDSAANEYSVGSLWVRQVCTETAEIIDKQSNNKYMQLSPQLLKAAIPQLKVDRVPTPNKPRKQGPHPPRRSQNDSKTRQSPKSNILHIYNKPKTPQENFQKEMTILDLEKDLIKEHKIKQKQNNRIKILQDQIVKSKKQYSKLVEEHQLLKNMSEQYRIKIQLMEKNIMENQHILNEANSKLQNLKRTIKQARIQQLNQKNMSLLKQNSKIGEQNAKLNFEIQALRKDKVLLEVQVKKVNQQLEKQKIFKVESMKQQYLVKEVQSLKEKLKQSRSQQQQVLEHQIQSLQRKLQKSRQQANSLQIKLSCINKKYAEQMKQLKQTKDSELTDLRKKFNQLNHKLKQSTKDKNNIRSSSALPMPRNSILNVPRDRKSSLDVTFQLSPQP